MSIEIKTWLSYWKATNAVAVDEIRSFNQVHRARQYCSVMRQGAFDQDLVSDLQIWNAIREMRADAENGVSDAVNSIMSDDESPLTAEEQSKIDDAWEMHKAAGPWVGNIRPHLRPDGVPTRIDAKWMTAAELAIKDAMAVVESAGTSVALTDALNLLAKARERVADHAEAALEVKE